MGWKKLYRIRGDGKQLRGRWGGRDPFARARVRFLGVCTLHHNAPPPFHRRRLITRRSVYTLYTHSHTHTHMRAVYIVAVIVLFFCKTIMAGSTRKPLHPCRRLLKRWEHPLFCYYYFFFLLFRFVYYTLTIIPGPLWNRRSAEYRPDRIGCKGEQGGTAA